MNEEDWKHFSRKIAMGMHIRRKALAAARFSHPPQQLPDGVLDEWRNDEFRRKSWERLGRRERVEGGREFPVNYLPCNLCFRGARIGAVVGPYRAVYKCVCGQRGPDVTAQDRRCIRCFHTLSDDEVIYCTHCRGREY